MIWVYPTLLIVQDLILVETVLRERGFRVFNTDTVEEAREVIGELRDIRVSVPVVLSDVSALGGLQASLLKFVEETKLKLVLLASKDNITSVLLSRIKRVVKDPRIISYERNSLKAFREAYNTDGQDISPETIVESCPGMAEFQYRLGRARLPVKGKLLELLMGGF